MPDERGFSIVRLPHAWYVACRSRDLGRRPLAREVLGTPLVLFRDDHGGARALLDRCAHRNLPLSLGRTHAGRIECAYHGWQFDGEGACRLVPALPGEPGARARAVPAFATREQQGFVWVWATPGEEPRGAPFAFPLVGRPGYQSLHFSYAVEATLHATLENMLDVPHTAFLHRGLFRGGRRTPIRAVVRRWRDRTECEYQGEPRPSGLAARLLAPGTDAPVAHVDRFRLPSISEVEYRLGEASHLLVCAALTPVSDFITRFHAVVSFRLPVPPLLVRLLVTPVAKRIFRQDAAILRRQTASLERFGGEDYTSTEVDLLGPQILKVLRDAAAEPSVGDDGGPPVFERQIELLA